MQGKSIVVRLTHLIQNYVAHLLHILKDSLSDWMALAEQNCAQSMGYAELVKSR
jgi:uncharacterized HAD superfamily protein